MVRIQFHPAAIIEARDARRWYAAREPEVADAFMREFDAAIKHIARFPKTWPLFEIGTRRKLLKRFPLHVIYREVPDAVEIVAVMHERRRPGDWHNR